MKKIFKSYYRFVDKTSLCIFFLGLLGGLMFYFKTEDNYEKNLFEALASSIRQHIQVDNDSVLLLQSLKTVHNTIQPRYQVFQHVRGFKADVLQPVTVDLMTGQGACGSYALVMGRLMVDMGFEARIAQMKVAGVYGGHNIIEVKLKDQWVILDPLYNLYFKKPDGNLASFKDVQNNWEFYKKQVPAGYNAEYKYEDVRYTNWNKIPVIMPGLKKVLDWILGKENANQLSIRIMMIRKFNVYFNLTLFVTLLLITYVIFISRKKTLTPLASDKKEIKNAPLIETDGTVIVLKTAGPNQKSSISK